MAAVEQKKSYHVTKDFKGLNTKANRTAIREDEFAWLENVMPIGYSNLKVIPKEKRVTYTGTNFTWGGVVHYMAAANINGTAYMFAFFTNGGAQYVNLETPTAPVTLAAAATFSGTRTQISQWKNERVLIIDTTYGYATFNGTNLVRVGSVGTVTVTAGGSGYTSAPIVTFSVPNDTGGIQATATATISSNLVTAITINERGTGYTSAPTVYIGTSGATAWVATTAFQTGRLLSSGGNYYYVTVGGTTSSTAPSHTSGSATNGTCTLLYVADPNGAGSAATATATAINQPGTCIQSFSGRVWIADKRTIYYTAADSYNDFTSISAGNITLVDATLYGDITQIIAANNFLYVFGESSINVFSDVRVNTLGETLFTNTNISASIGTELFLGVFAYFRSILFINRYGVYALVGATTTKISDALDGIFPNIDFSAPISGCQTIIYNILVSAWNVRYNDNGTFRRIQLIFFDRKWFISYQGTLTHINSSPVNGLINVYGVEESGAFYRLYEDQTANIATEIVTALWPLTDPIRTKQALKIGVEATIGANAVGTIQATVDSENASSPVITLTNGISWINNFLQTIPWTNNSSQTVAWTPTGYALYKYDAQQYGKYLGFTVTSVSPAFTYNGFQLEHELRVRF